MNPDETAILSTISTHGDEVEGIVAYDPPSNTVHLILKGDVLEHDWTPECWCGPVRTIGKYITYFRHIRFSDPVN